MLVFPPNPAPGGRVGGPPASAPTFRVVQRRLNPLSIIATALAGVAVLVSTALRDDDQVVERNLEPLATPTTAMTATNADLAVEDEPAAQMSDPLFEHWLRRWQDTRALDPALERNAALAGLLEDLASRDPLRARDLALAECDESLRHDLLRALISGWASVDIEGAGRWALSQTFLYTDAALAAVFHGGRAQPDEAIRYARALSVAEPARRADIGQYLIAALGEADEHSRAATYAVEGSECAQPWLTAAFSRWARQDPESAMRTAIALEDADHRRTAYRAAISGWARSSPQNLVTYAVDLPHGEDRNFALMTGLRAWSAREPEAAAAWIAQARPIVGVELVLED
jgi:hypothetical protein